MINWIMILGLTAALFTTTSLLPQAVKAIKTKKTGDLSLLTYFVLTTGVALWLIYGLIIKDIPVIAANGVALIFSLIILTLKIKYK